MNKPMRSLSLEARQRLRVSVRGAVQGVGFRPFVFRLAQTLNLAGWVTNSTSGVFIEVEAERPRLEAFLDALQREKPPRAFIQSLEHSYLDPVGYRTFEIHESDRTGEKTALVLPDIATCPECLREIFDPSNRRYLYPFTNCTHCGPRYTIIEALPYDRAHTSMKKFQMCARCRHEYEHPENRRFHAQPNACPECGPALELWSADGTTLARHHAALQRAADAVRDGRIVAIKGIGGFHLVVDARNEEAVRRLRSRKHREEKPFALMFRNLASVRQVCDVSPVEERLLQSPEAPIVLLRKKENGQSNGTNGIPAPSVAPHNPYLGVMLPYSPLHHILMRELGFPIVATSGNLSDEPICIDEHEALKRLHNIADLFLVHDRPIVRHADDSIVREMGGREMVVRRARGFAPLPVLLPNTEESDHRPALAVGAHLKNSVALLIGRNAFVSQHIGDLETFEAYEAFKRVIADLSRLYETHPRTFVCDMHPDYLSTRYAQLAAGGASEVRNLAEVQHHVAHVAACMADNDLRGRVLGISWDGTGYGLDGSVWGGEFFSYEGDGFRRVATFRQFRLPGGEAAIKEPRRTAIGVLFEMFGKDVFEKREVASVAAFSPEEVPLIRQMLEKSINAPLTSSVGRLFDAVASLAGLRHHVRHEGQAAMELEFAIGSLETNEAYPFLLSARDNGGSERPLIVVDWEPAMVAVLHDLHRNEPMSLIAARFHNMLVEAAVRVAERIGEERVVLSGGCFQNKYLTEHLIARLRQEGFRPYWHQRVPPNDGGIALGQLYASVIQRCDAVKSPSAPAHVPTKSPKGEVVI